MPAWFVLLLVFVFGFILSNIFLLKKTANMKMPTTLKSKEVSEETSQSKQERDDT